MEKTLAVIMAGGRGERLCVLAQERAKPAVPFAGKYRLIDFTLNNCVNSGIAHVFVLTQYQPLSLVNHIGIGTPWGLAAPGKSVQLLQPYLAREEGRDWYKGTADAVYQNIKYIDRQDSDRVLILSGDHIYKMDYSWLFKYHQDKQADVTLAYTHVPEAELSQFGTVVVDENGQVTGFEEKVKNPKSNLVSMGVYLFNKDILLHCLEEDAKSMFSRHDFGRDILPRLFGKRKLFGYDYRGYWRDVGTLQSYWQTNMDMIEMSPSGYLSDAGWPIRTNEDERTPSIFAENAKIVNSLVANGCIIKGTVEHSVLSSGVIVSEGAVVKDSIILSDTIIGPQSIVDRAILDERVSVGAGCCVGFGDDLRPNRKEPNYLNTGLTIIGRWAKIPPKTIIGRNCLVSSKVEESDFHTAEIKSGETINPRQ